MHDNRTSIARQTQGKNRRAKRRKIMKKKTMQNRGKERKNKHEKEITGERRQGITKVMIGIKKKEAKGERQMDNRDKNRYKKKARIDDKEENR